jgi:abequosyltransferase
MNHTSMGRATALTICIPVYNFGAFLGETLDSILPQLVPGIEVVVVDGASTDDTSQVVARRMPRCPQLRYVLLERRGGIDADIALSVEHAAGEFCWLFSGDDIMRPGALSRVLSWLPSGHDVLVCRHSNCDKNMRRLEDHPVLLIDQVTSADFADPEQRHRYLAAGVNTEALFSFMSGLIIRRSAWLSVPAPDQFMGSCWGHVARLLSIARTRLRVCYVAEIWLDKRGDNDSFLDRGLVNRLKLAVDGYLGIATCYFGANSWEVAQVRRFLRNELGLRMFIKGQNVTRLNPAQESRVELDRLMFLLYTEEGFRLALARVIYRFFPAPLYPLLRAVYVRLKKSRMIRSIYRNLPLQLKSIARSVRPNTGKKPGGG